MQVNKNKLLETMRKALPGIEKGAAMIEGADSFIFDEGVVHSFNDQISVTTDTGMKELTGAVKSLDFYKLVSKFRQDEIELEVEDGKWRIKAGRTKGTITLLSDTISTHVEALNVASLKWEALPENFSNGLRLCLMPANNTPLRGIYQSAGEMISTDSVRMNRYTLDSELPPFWLDDPAVMELLKFGELSKICVTDGWIHFRGETETVFSCRQKNIAEFPAVKVTQVLADMEKADSIMKARFPEGLEEAVDRISVLSTDIRGAASVRLTFKKKALEIFSSRISGEISETVPWLKPLQLDENIQLWVDSSFLLEASKKSMQFSLRDAGGGRKVLFFKAKGYIQIASTMAEKA